MEKLIRNKTEKINKNIPIIKNYFNGRRILICREISKLYEEYLRSTVEELKLFQDMPKGELTLVLSEKKMPYKEARFLKNVL